MITYHLRIGEIGNVVRSENDDEAGSGDDSDGRDDAAGIRRQQTTVAAALVIPSRPFVKKRVKGLLIFIIQYNFHFLSIKTDVKGKGDAKEPIRIQTGRKTHRQVERISNEMTHLMGHFHSNDRL